MGSHSSQKWVSEEVWRAIIIWSISDCRSTAVVLDWRITWNHTNTGDGFAILTHSIHVDKWISWAADGSGWAIKLIGRLGTEHAGSSKVSKSVRIHASKVSSSWGINQTERNHDDADQGTEIQQLEHDCEVGVHSISKEEIGISLDEFIDLWNFDVKLLSNGVFECKLELLWLLFPAAENILPERPDNHDICIEETVSLLDLLSGIVDLLSVENWVLVLLLVDKRLWQIFRHDWKILSSKTIFYIINLSFWQP